jgi:hypothetical protein
MVLGLLIVLMLKACGRSAAGLLDEETLTAARDPADSPDADVGFQFDPGHARDHEGLAIAVTRLRGARSSIAKEGQL